MPRLLLLFSTALALSFLFLIGNSLAKTDLSITGTDITFSRDEPVEGDSVRAFARVFNIGDTDVYGFVIFLDNGKEIADPQPISVKMNTYDDVFINWLVKSGVHTIQAKIIGTNISDEDSGNNTAVRNDYFVDLDTDGDKIGNKKDDDDDNDGLTDEKEFAVGTDSLDPDSDRDRVRDNIDPFPMDSKEWRDSDSDGLGENADTDDDNDGLSDDDELFTWGSNPTNSDSDGDGFSDKKEADLGTNLLKKDSDGDGVIDSKDGFPLDPAKNQASLIGAVRQLSPKTLAVIITLPLLIIISLFLRKKPR
jgi:hypothetical protein